jgi:hypothetical protein
MDASGRPDALDERVRQWQQRYHWLYWNALSTAPGTKVGGYPRWIQAPQWPVCECGLRMRHLLTIASEEFDGHERWLPLEDRDDPKITGRRLLTDRVCWAPHGLMLGDVGSLYLFTCTAHAERPLAGTMQCPDDHRSLSGSGSAAAVLTLGQYWRAAFNERKIRKIRTIRKSGGTLRQNTFTLL